MPALDLSKRDHEPTVQDKIRSWQREADSVASGTASSVATPRAKTAPSSRSTDSVTDQSRKQAYTAKTPDRQTTSTARLSRSVELITESDTGHGRRPRAAGIKVHRQSATQPSPETSKPKVMSTEVDLEKRAWVRRRAPTSANNDIIHATMPSKRVVSDGRWRKDSASAATSPAGASTSPSAKSPSSAPTQRILVQKSTPDLRHTSSASSRPRSYMTRPTTRSRHTADHAEKTASERSLRRSRMTGRSPQHRSFSPDPPDEQTIASSIDTTPRLPSVTSRTKTNASSTPTRPSPTALTSSPTLSDYLPRSPARHSLHEPGPYSASLPTTYDATSVTTPHPDDSISRVGHTVQPRVRRQSRSFMHNIFSHNIVKEKHKTKENMSPELVQQQNSSPKSAGDRIDAWLEHTDDDVFRVTAEQDSRVEVRRRAAQHQSEAISQDTSTYITETSTENTSPPRGSPRTASTQPTRRPLEVRTYRVAGDPVVSKVKIDSRGQEISSETTATVSDTTARPSTNEQPKRPLSTIVSVTTDHTVSTASRPTILKTHSDVTRHTSRTARRSSHRKSRRTTTHDDLISVLSMPPEDAPPLMSARSVRKRRETLDSPFASILKELELDEQRYRQELRTLVKGVVPVLRSHELNKDSASITTASNVPDSPSVAGIGRILDKLWSQHDRMPTNDAKAFIAWTNVVQSVYQDYLAAWKMGFDDVTVNLGPANHDGLPSVVSVTNPASTDDNRVDVAFLLKRPLVRLKTLHRTLQDLDDTDSTLGAEPMALQFRDLVAEARKKSNEERARLEDEAAAAIDASKTRDPYTLQRLTGIKIDPTRIVRARDYFDMTLHHSAGQTTDCRIELLLRDDRDDAIADGDVLICEVTNLGRWLLFPPMPHDSVMVKAGLQVNELHVTLCDTLRDGSERRETMLLRSIEPDVTEQWLEMLSEYVEPPHIKSQPKQLPVATADDAVDRPPPVPFHRHSVASSGSLSSRSELHTPIGETTSPYKKRWTATETLAQATPNAFHHQQDLPAVQDRRQPRPIYDNAPPIQSDAASLISGSGSGYSSRDNRSERPYSAYSDDIASQMYPDLQQAQRPHTADDQMQRSRDMPANPQSPPRSPRRKPVATPTRPIVEPITSQRVERTPQSAPPKLEGQRPREVAFQEETLSTPKLKSKPKLGFIPALKTTLGFRPRRPSSPLKHEYAPSPSGSELDSDPESSHDDDDASITSESSHESDDEFDDKPLPINIRKYRDERPGSALVRVPVAGALSPSSSPVPSPSRGNSRPVSRQIQPVTKAVAGIYSWAETGSWEKLRERDVAIVVSPGLLEAFDMHEVHSVPDTGQSPTVSGIMPLIALELTPLVPIRRGTALDISIRSPPAPMSRIKRTDNVMLRSRSPEECETLYHYINQSRINNATFIAMQAQSAQMPVAVPVADVDWANTIGPPGSRRGPASWLSQHGPRRAGSYRNRSSRRSLISGGTMQSALSALRRFSHGGGGTSGGGRLRNLAKGVSSSRSTETRTLSFSKATTTTGASGSSGTQNSANSAGGESQAHTGLTVLSSTITAPEGLGLNNTKIRLYIRETASKWRDLGNARLTVSLPPAPQQQVSEDGAGDDEDEKEDTAQLDPLDALHAGKRITIQALPSRVPSRSDMTMMNTAATTTTMATVLLDQVLPETAFERVARTGIAVSVWEESVDAQGTLGGSRDRGGVVAGVQRVYMLQMASERECAYTFGLVGKQRY